jgi:hypothetical protein
MAFCLRYVDTDGGLLRLIDTSNQEPSPGVSLRAAMMGQAFGQRIKQIIV